MLTIVCCVCCLFPVGLHTEIGMQSKVDVLIKFGERVRKLRKERGLSQEELAFKANLHRTYIGMIERAEKNITLINIEKIAIALEVPVDEIFKR